MGYGIIGLLVIGAVRLFIWIAEIPERKEQAKRHAEWCKRYDKNYQIMKDNSNYFK